LRVLLAVGILGAAGLVLLGPPLDREDAVRAALLAGHGVVELPAGLTEVSSELVIPAGSHDLEIRGAPGGTVLRASARFHGRAVIRCEPSARVTLRGFTIDGNRAALEQPLSLPPSNVTFARFYRNNGILADRVLNFTIRDVHLREVANYPVLVSRSRTVLIERVRIGDSGSRNAAGKNNASGGILLEDGTSGFTVRDCRLENVRGNGIWTHSRFASPRNASGLIAGNRFRMIGRDAVQVGHAVRVRVERNSGSFIGYPAEEVDMESGAIPAALDTAGDTAGCAYVDNRFEEINGKCIDLDGFHDGEIRGNRFVNRRPPDAYPHANVGIVFNDSHPHTRSNRITVEDNEIDGLLFTGIFVIGPGHRIVNNRLLNLNRAHCNENRARFGCYNPAGDPDLLQSGIYLGRGVLRPNPARESLIRDNLITGYRMRERCIVAAPGLDRRANLLEGNRCRDVVAAPAGSP